ncbi:hypothetical protein [Turneriella parva]|nr:hypothetical protein [Turneriella parva]
MRISKLYLALLGLGFVFVACKEEPETTYMQRIRQPSPSQIPPDYKYPVTIPVDMKSEHYFDQSELYSEKAEKPQGEWRTVSLIPNVQLEFPKAISFRSNYQMLNEKPYSLSPAPLPLERYSFVDPALEIAITNDPENRGSEACTTTIHFDIIPNITVQSYAKRRIREDPMFYSLVKRINVPRKGFYVKISDMFTYIHELWLENGTGLYRLKVVEPFGRIPEKSRLTSTEVLYILFSIKLPALQP